VYRTETGKTLTLVGYLELYSAWCVAEYENSIYDERFLSSCTLISEPETETITTPFTPHDVDGQRKRLLASPTVAPKAPLNPHDFSDPYCVEVAHYVSNAGETKDPCRRCKHCGTSKMSPRFDGECIPWNWRYDNERRIREAMDARGTAQTSSPETGHSDELAKRQSHLLGYGCLGVWDIRGGR